MRRVFFLALFGSLVAGSLTYFYLQSESSLAAEHQETLRGIAYARELNASLDKDVLKARNFLLTSYDSIVHWENELTRNCEKMQSGLEKLGEGPQISRPLADYCGSVRVKLTHIETFKSRNAVLRNSFYFLHKVATEASPAPRNPVTGPSQQLMRSALAYFLLSTDEARARLEADIGRASALGLSGEGEFGLVLAHSDKLLRGKAEIDRLVAEITSPLLEERINSLSRAYFYDYEKANDRAATYRKLLFTACIVFLGLVICGVIRLWRNAKELADANANLEKRVDERTRELKQSQQALAASAKMSALGEMAGGIAHEINNPLASMKAIAGQIGEMLHDDPLDQNLLGEMTAKIEQTADRIAKIVQGLRTFSRDGSRDSLQSVSVKRLVEETISLCGEKFRNHEVRLSVDEIPAALVFEGREIEISQVLLNLLNNAHDAISAEKEKWVRISVAEEAEHIAIRVTDCGRGIPPEIQKKIFQPFFTTKEIGRGTGLGLSISLGIVNGHRGDLTLDGSCPNTCFLLRLRKRLEQKDKIPANAA